MARTPVFSAMNKALAMTLVMAMGIALAVAFALAAIPTFIDWHINPSGIFHDTGGTHWGFVRETFLSWFFPILLLCAPVAFAGALLLWLRRG